MGLILVLVNISGIIIIFGIIWMLFNIKINKINKKDIIIYIIIISLLEINIPYNINNNINIYIDNIEIIIFIIMLLLGVIKVITK